MTFALIFDNLLSPPILFFFAGVFAVAVRSNLSIPRPIVSAISLYLLFAIGTKGGYNLSKDGFGSENLVILLSALAFSFAAPLLSFAVLRRLTDSQNAAALSACLGSVSAVTFVTAVNYIDARSGSYSGVMIAAMALMESPAIIVGIFLANWTNKEGGKRPPLRTILHEALTGGAVLLLLAGLLIGFLCGEDGWQSIEPFASGLFPGMLCFFLLDMGQTAASRLRALTSSIGVACVAGIVLPLMLGMSSLLLSKVLGLSSGDALLFAVLCGSASYIAVPAAIRVSIPKAEPSIYVSTALGVTFPFNIIFGIPLYASVIEYFFS